MNKRVKSVEVLRVVAMFLIVMSHYMFHGLKENNLHSIYDMSSISGWVDYFTMEPLWILSCVAVNCYVMITGYFLIDKPVFRWGRMMKTWVQTLFYSVVLLLFGIFLLKEQPLSWFQVFTPIYSNIYWFVTTYVGLLLVAPLLSIVATSISKNLYGLLLVVYFVFTFEFLYGKVYSGFATLTWFSYLFFFAGYIKLYGLPEWIVQHRKTLFLAIWGILFAFATGLNYVKSRDTFMLMSTAYNGPIFFLSISFFVLFTYKEEKNRQFWGGYVLNAISALAPYTFGVYLIHEHPSVSAFLWKDIIPIETNMPIVIYMLGSVLTIYVCCLCIDYIRSICFKAVGINKLVDYLNRKSLKLN